MAIIKPLDPFSEVVDERRRWTPDWYSWFTDVASAIGSAGSGGITALTADVSAVGPGSVAATIQPNKVDNSKLAQMPALTFKGNNTGLLGTAVDLTVAQALALLGVREPLQANRTYFVAPASSPPAGWSVGSDSNNGLAQTGTAPNGPFATLQKALNVAYGLIDLRGFNVTIQLAGTTTTPCTYGQGAVNAPQVGAGNITINGNAAARGSVTIGTLTCYRNALLLVGNLTIADSYCIVVQFSGILQLAAPIIFGPASFAHVFVTGFGTFDAVGFPYTIAGDAQQHMLAQTQGYATNNGSTVTLSGTRTFSSAFAFAANLSQINVAAAGAGSYLGPAAVGTRFVVDLNSVVYVNGAGLSFLPGNAPGSIPAGRGGQYL